MAQESQNFKIIAVIVYLFAHHRGMEGELKLCAANTFTHDNHSMITIILPVSSKQSGQVDSDLQRIKRAHKSTWIDWNGFWSCWARNGADLTFNHVRFIAV